MSEQSPTGSTATEADPDRVAERAVRGAVTVGIVGIRFRRRVDRQALDDRPIQAA